MYKHFNEFTAAFAATCFAHEETDHPNKGVINTSISAENFCADDVLDFVFVTGDAYVDHPSFAAALLSRLLESQGYTVGILSQPNWKTADDFTAFGRPRYAFLVSSGAMDSMVAHYTANKKPRSSDAYSHGGISAQRPDRALIAYCAKIREAYKNISLVVGGIEASLRRFAHYDYWSSTIKHSILLDTKADLLLYGMGEHSIIELAGRFSHGEHASTIRGVRGSVWRTGKFDELPLEAVFLPSFEMIRANDDTGKQFFAESFLIQERNTDAHNAHIVVEQSENRYVVQELPALPLTTEEFDAVMELPYTRRAYPKNDVPALQEVLFSLTSCRGCFGACSFCAITFHQGRVVQSRSHESLIREAQEFIVHPEFKGYIHDVGGPTANFRIPACPKQATHGACPDRQCLGTEPCPQLCVDHRDYVALLRKLRSITGVKKVFIRSGIRFDYVMLDRDPEKTFFHELCEHHISGQLKVAPEHVSQAVLDAMRKSSHKVFVDFCSEFKRINTLLNKKQYILPYYIASHPGATLKDAVENAEYLKKTHFFPDQVQDFYPTPGTLSTCMYYTGLDPRTMKPLHVARGQHERSLQRALLQSNKKENTALVREALLLCKDQNKK